jgi:glycosyltransferase involved in cell wall biosynthesis
MKIVITIPAYNEEKTLGSVLRDIKQVMDKREYSYRLLVVNDGSRDRTADVAKKGGATVFSHPQNLGLAETFRTEMEQCLKMDADVIVHTDADGQYRAEDIPKLLKKIEEGYDMVLGSRFKGHIESMPLIKRFGNKAFSKVISNIVNMKITDGQTGFRAFTREVAKTEITSTHTYTQEQIIRVVRHKFKVVEIPAYFAKRGAKTKSRLMKNPFDYAIKAWINILRVYRDYEPLKFFGMIGGLFFILGFLAGIWIIYTLITTGRVGGIPRVMLSALFMIVGIQIIVFGFLADMFKK